MKMINDDGVGQVTGGHVSGLLCPNNFHTMTVLHTHCDQEMIVLGC